MWAPSKYDIVYPLSYLFTFTIATPHSIMAQLAWPEANLAQGPPLHPQSAAPLNVDSRLLTQVLLLVVRGGLFMTSWRSI
jgi:hypothetical protein